MGSMVNSSVLEEDRAVTRDDAGSNGASQHSVPDYRLCLATPRANAYCETFIQKHIQRLQPVCVLHGQPLACDVEEGVIRDRGLTRLSGKLQQTVLRRKKGDVHRERLTRYFQRHRVNVAMAEYGPTGLEVMPVCRRADVPLVVHFHGKDAHCVDVIERHGERYREMFAMAAGIIAVSRAMREQLISLGAPGEKVHYAPCMVDANEFDLGAPDQAPPHFVAVGRFVEKKGPHLALMAFAKVAAAVPDAHFTLIGDGPLLGPCQHLADVLGIEDQVTFTGPREHLFVRDQMKASRAFVQHSLRAVNGDCEGTPVAVLEASASGLPVVATKHTGIKDVVRDQETGYLVDERDVEGMAEGMLRLAGDAELAKRLGLSGRERILEHFGDAQTTGKVCEVIKQVARR